MQSLFLGLGLLLSVSLLDIRLAKAQQEAPESTTTTLAEPTDPTSATIISELSPKIETLKRADLLKLGKAYSAEKNPQAAIKVFTAILAKNAKDVEAKTLIGAEQLKIAVSKEQTKEALDTLKGAIDINPKYLPAYRELIKYYESRIEKSNLSSNKADQRIGYSELRIIYQDLVERIGPKTEFVTQLCKITTLDGLYDLSTKYCKQGIALAPKEPSNFVYQGISMKETGQADESEKVLKKAAGTFAKSELAQLTYAQTQTEKKNYILAYTYYKRAVIANLNSVPALLGLAQSAMEIQKIEEALDAFQRACRRDRTVVPHVRRAKNTLRTLKKQEWEKKFEELSDSCGN